MTHLRNGFIHYARLDTGFKYIAYVRGFRVPWERLVETTAAEFGCDPDDVDLVEDEDGGETFLTVRGERVAREIRL